MFYARVHCNKDDAYLNASNFVEFKCELIQKEFPVKYFYLLRCELGIKKTWDVPFQTHNDLSSNKRYNITKQLHTSQLLGLSLMLWTVLYGKFWISTCVESVLSLLPSSSVKLLSNCGWVVKHPACVCHLVVVPVTSQVSYHQKKYMGGKDQSNRESLRQRQKLRLLTILLEIFAVLSFTDLHNTFHCHFYLWQL